MGFTAPGECEDKDHVVIGDKIQFSTDLLKELVENRVILEIKGIEVREDGVKEIHVSNVKE